MFNNNNITSEASNFVKFNSDNSDNNINSNGGDATTELSDKNREMRFMNSSLNPNAAEFYPSYYADDGGCFTKAIDQDYEFDQSYDVNKFSVDNDATEVEVERLNGGLAIDCDKEQQNLTMSDYYGQAGSNTDSGNVCGDYQYDKHYHHVAGYMGNECGYASGNVCNTNFGTAMPPNGYNDNYVRNAPVYFNGYPNFGSPNMDCSLYYGANMYLTQLGELFVPQPYSCAGMHGMPYLHYAGGMLKCNEFYDPGEHYTLGENRKGVDPQLKILYQRPMPKKSRAIEIMSPDSLENKSDNSKTKLDEQEEAKKEKQQNQQQEQLAAKASHFVDRIAKKSMSAQEMELTFNKQHVDFQHHSIAGLLLLPRNLLEQQNNAKLSRIQGSLNLHVGSTATITDNAISSGIGSGASRASDGSGTSTSSGSSGSSIKQKECIEGKSYFLTHGSMRELKFEYEKFCSGSTIPTTLTTAIITNANDANTDRCKKRNEALKVHFNLAHNESVTKAPESQTSVNERQGIDDKQLSQFEAHNYAFELRHSNDLDNIGRTTYIKSNIKKPIPVLNKNPINNSVTKQPVFSILCRKTTNNNEASPPQTYGGSTAKALENLTGLHESKEELNEHDVDQTQKMQEIHATIDERIKRVLSNNSSNKYEQIKDGEEMLKNINELELSESLIALSKKIAKSLDFNHDAIMQAAIPQELVQPSSDAKPPTNLNGAINDQQSLVIQHALNIDVPTSTAMLAKEPLDIKNSDSTLTSFISGSSSKSSLQPVGAQVKRSQGKIFSNLPFLKSRQKSTVGYVDMKLNDVKKAKENERKRDALKKLEAKQLVKKESLEKKQLAKEEKEKERQKEREKEKLKEKAKKSKETEEKHKKTSSVASSVRRIFVPRFENKSANNSNLNEPVPPLKGFETKKISTLITTRSGSSGTSLPSQKTSTLYVTKKQLRTARSPTTTSHLGNTKETIKAPLTSRGPIATTSTSSATAKSATSTAHINSETMGLTRTIFTRTIMSPLDGDKNAEKPVAAALGVDAKSASNQRPLRKPEHPTSPKATATVTQNAVKDAATGLPAKNVQGDSAPSTYVEELQKYYETHRKHEKSKTTCLISAPTCQRKPGDLAKLHTHTEELIGGGSIGQLSKPTKTKISNAGPTSCLCKKRDDNQAGHEATTGFLSMNSIIKLVDNNKRQSATAAAPPQANARENVVVQKIFKNCTCLSELRSGNSANNSTSTSPLNSSKLEANVIQTPYSLTDFTTTNTTANSSNIPNSARINKQQLQQQQPQLQQSPQPQQSQQQISPPTSSRNNKVPRDTVASQLRKIEIQKRQNLFPEDTHTSSPADNHQNIKMSQYLFK